MKVSDKYMKDVQHYSSGKSRQNRFTPTRMVRQMITSVGEDMRRLGLYVAGVNVKWCSCLENSLADPYKVNKNFLTQQFHC